MAEPDSNSSVWEELFGIVRQLSETVDLSYQAMTSEGDKVRAGAAPCVFSKRPHVIYIICTIQF